LPFGAADWSTDSIESYPNLWWFDFGIGNDCSGQHFCNEGSFSAERVTSDLSNHLEEIFANSALREVDILERPPYVTGYYIHGFCGAYCADSMLFWQSQNKLYTIATKFPGDDPESILDLKKSALSFIKSNLKAEKTPSHSTQSIKIKKEVRLQGVWSKHQYIMVKGKKIPVPTYLPYEKTDQKVSQKPHFYYYLDFDLATWPNYYFNFSSDPRCESNYCMNVSYSVFDIPENLSVERIFSISALREVELFKDEGSTIKAYFIPKRQWYRIAPARLFWVYDNKLFTLEAQGNVDLNELPVLDETAIPELKKSAESVMKAYKPLKSTY
jgi:hypothetical protein